MTKLVQNQQILKNDIKNFQFGEQVDLDSKLFGIFENQVLTQNLKTYSNIIT